MRGHNAGFTRRAICRIRTALFSGQYAGYTRRGLLPLGAHTPDTHGLAEHTPARRIHTAIHTQRGVGCYGTTPASSAMVSTRKNVTTRPFDAKGFFAYARTRSSFVRSLRLIRRKATPCVSGRSTAERQRVSRITRTRSGDSGPARGVRGAQARSHCSRGCVRGCQTTARGRRLRPKQAA